MRFPFSDQAQFKRRPAVIISNAAYAMARGDVVGMAVTSRFRLDGEFGDIAVHAWQFAGLLKPSGIKLNIATFDVTIIDAKLGELGLPDRQALRQAIVRLFA